MAQLPKSVPLTAYIDGERYVIGHAELVDDGNDIVVNAKMDEAFAKKFLQPVDPEVPMFSMDSSTHSTHFGYPQSD